LIEKSEPQDAVSQGEGRGGDTRFVRPAVGVVAGGHALALLSRSSVRDVRSSDGRDVIGQRRGFVRNAVGTPGGGYIEIMLDVALIALLVVFFVVADLFVGGCRRVVDRGSDEGPGGPE